MRLLSRMLIVQFVPVLIVSLVFFVLVLQLVDLFSNLVRFLDLEIPISEIAHAQLLYVPKSVSFALPIAVLFSASYTLGLFYSNNELIAVLASGVPLYRFVLPLVFAGLVMSVGAFFFEEHVVIDTFTRKTALTRELLNVNRSFSNTDVTLLSAGNRVIYTAEYYNDDTNSLSGLTILMRDEAGRVSRRIDADWAEWREDKWILNDVVSYERNGEDELERKTLGTFTDERLTAEPATFRRRTQNVDEMHLAQMKRHIEELRSAGLAYRQALTDYYERFSFALTPFIVTLIASVVGSRFQKNILLMSLLTSLSLAVIYYITGMVAGLLASAGTIPPWAGAWAGFVFFLGLGIIGFRYVRT